MGSFCAWRPRDICRSGSTRWRTRTLTGRAGHDTHGQRVASSTNIRCGRPYARCATTCRRCSRATCGAQCATCRTTQSRTRKTRLALSTTRHSGGSRSFRTRFGGPDGPAMMLRSDGFKPPNLATAAPRPACQPATRRAARCEADDSGSFRVAGMALAIKQARDAHGMVEAAWPQLVAKCVALCSTCARCRFISVSVVLKACDWYHSCPYTFDTPGRYAGKGGVFVSGPAGDATDQPPGLVNSSRVLATARSQWRVVQRSLSSSAPAALQMLHT